MLKGIDNAIIIKNIFGEKNIFEKAELLNISYQMIDSRIELSILLHDEPINIPKKWGEFESVYLRIEFYGLNSLTINLKEDRPRIDDVSIFNDNDKYNCRIFMNDEQQIQFIFEIARVQNIKPFVDRK